MDVTSLTRLLREAEERHGQYEAVAPPHHWSDWYAAFIVARDEGVGEEQAAASAGRHVDSVLR
jgi:hypothetical protein